MKRLKNIVGWALMATLSLFYSALLGSLSMPWVPTTYHQPTGNAPYGSCSYPIVGVFTATCLVSWGILLALAIIISWLCGKKNWDTKGYYRGGSLLLLLALTTLFLVDAPPVENGYTWDSIPSPRKDAEKSHGLIMSLESIEFPANDEVMRLLGMDDDPTNLLAHASAIESMWSDIEPARRVIENLDGFDEVGNLVIPSGFLQGWSKRSEFIGMPFMKVRGVYQRYWVYASLKVAQGRPEEGVRPLVQLHSVCRKALPFSKSILHKMIWTAVCSGTIYEAHKIAVNPHCGEGTLRLLKEGFAPLTEEEISCQGAFTGEYLLKRENMRLLPPANFFDSFFSGWPDESKQANSLWLHSTAEVVSVVAFRRNRTTEDMRRFFELLIAGTTKHPPDSSAADDFALTYSKRPDFRNMGGWLLASHGVIAGYNKAIGTMSRVKVLSDLLSIELHERLGEPVEIPDYFTGKQYIKDEKTGSLSSAGLDGIPGTPDDVVLGKGMLGNGI